MTVFANGLRRVTKMFTDPLGGDANRSPRFCEIEPSNECSYCHSKYDCSKYVYYKEDMKANENVYCKGCGTYLFDFSDEGFCRECSGY
jgi:hypothetical protein